MKTATIEIPQDIYAELMAIAAAVKAQNNRGTAKPYIFQVQESKRVFGVNDYENFVFVNDEGDEVLDSVSGNYEEELREFAADLCEDETFYKDCTLDRVENFLASEGYEKMYYHLVPKYSNAFFTEAACRRYIQAQSHNLSDPTDFLSYAPVNPELETMFKFFEAIGQAQPELSHK